MNQRTKNWIFISAFLAGLAGFVVGMVFKDTLPYVPLLFIASFLLLEARILWHFIEALVTEHSVGEELLVIVASGITIALGDYLESLSLVVMYMIGEFIIHLISRNNSAENESECHECCKAHGRAGRGVLAFLKYYVLAVLAGIAVVLILSAFLPIIEEGSILKTFAILLLIACPCTLFISTPLCKYYAVKLLAKYGMRFKDLCDLDGAAKAKTREEADPFLHELADPARAFYVAKRYKAKVVQNICIIIAAKIIFMVLSLWLETTLFAVGADLVIALVIFINSIFLGRKRKNDLPAAQGKPAA